MSTPGNLATVVRRARTDLGVTQAKLAERAHVSRWWIIQLEAGRSRAEYGLVLRVLDALDLELEAVPKSARPRPPEEIDLDKLLEEHLRD